MASANIHLLCLCFLLIFFSSHSLLAEDKAFQPKALVLQVSKDPLTLQYLTHVNQRTPLVSLKLTVDLGGQFLWVDCEEGYISSSYIPVPCDSTLCSLANSQSCITECYSSPKPDCTNNTCALTPDNALAPVGTGSHALGQDVVSIQSTTGSSPGPLVSVSTFLFTCAPTFLLNGLATGVKGMLGLGRTQIAPPSQFDSAFNLKSKFATCLPSSTKSDGVIFFGDGPYNMLPNVDVSKSLLYTTLIINNVSTASSYFQGEPSTEYFIGVRSINVNGKSVPINTSLLSIDSVGYGGTKISTLQPYTVMETSIYKAFTQVFIREMGDITRVASVAPFGTCFRSNNLTTTRVGPDVPQIDLVLQRKSVYWRIFGANSMVQVSGGVLCLGFVDGGSNPRTSIVIGGHQLEDNLLQFDLAKSTLGFSSSLLSRQTTCSNFNFINLIQDA